MHVLIIDDDDLNREILEAFLSLHDHHVSITGNGKQGIRAVEKLLPDLIILDMRLPDMSGLDICRTLRSRQHTSHIPIMMMTGLVDPELKHDALQSGVNCYMTRPFESDDFIRQVNMLLKISD